MSEKIKLGGNEMDKRLVIRNTTIDCKSIAKGVITLSMAEDNIDIALTEVEIELIYNKTTGNLSSSISAYDMNTEMIGRLIENKKCEINEKFSIIKSIGVVMNIEPVHNNVEKYIERINKSELVHLLDYNLVMNDILMEVCDYFNRHIFRNGLKVYYDNIGKIDNIK